MTTILIIEDQPEMVVVWEHFLKPFKAEIRIAKDISDAFELAKKIPPPDLILLDLILPPKHSNPFETLKEIEVLKSINPQAVVIVLTGAVENKLEQIAQEMGADAFALKQNVSTQIAFLAVIKQALEDRTNSKIKPFERSSKLLEQIASMTN